MADETQRDVRLAGLGVGAADEAPTAPHATPRAPSAGKAKRTGPAKFWAGSRMKAVYAGAFVVSIGIHYAVSPWSILPTMEFDIRDTEGEAEIPLDIFDDTPPEKPPEAKDAPKAELDQEKDPTQNTKNVVFIGDAAAPASGIVADAGADAAMLGAPRDAAPPPDAADAALPPASVAQLADETRAGEAIVRMYLNMEAIKTHDIGRQLGPLLSAIPQWDEFIEGTNVDVVRDTDWVTITGPSLKDTSLDVVLIHYSASDAVIDRAVDIVAKKHPSGGDYDAGVPHVKAALGHADRAVRIFLRPQSHLLAVVPQNVATRIARSLVNRRVQPHVLTPDQAFQLVLVAPNAVIPQIPPQIKSLKLSIFPRPADAAEVFIDGECGTEAEAKEAYDKVKSTIDGFARSFVVRIATNGLLDGVDVKQDGKIMKLHLLASKDQLQTLLNFVSATVKDMKSKP